MERERQEHHVVKPAYGVKEERNYRIPMRDGITLSADVLRPDAEGRFPVILEYHPYRKDDLTRHSYNALHYLAERGFAAVRVDVRGTGSSEGINTDEYMEAEQQDGFEAVEWCARQPWSNGRVGMYGLSYGGFTSIQVAMLRPPHLKAIVPMAATDDRYSDDCHYAPGGSMRMFYDVGYYGGFMAALNALPPPPESAGPRWAELWRERLEKNEPYILKWVQHPVDGPYWRSGSLRPDYDRIECPVFLIAGWHDLYSRPMLRIFQHLKGPKKLLMGPWCHGRPNAVLPGPQIDYLNEVARFFAHWLREEDTGIMEEPSVTVYMQEYTRPSRTLESVPGQWRAEEAFPLKEGRELTLFLGEGTLRREAEGSEAYDEFEYVPTAGVTSGDWSGGGVSYCLPDDQRADEPYSLVYTTAPFDEDTPLLGWPRVILHASSSARVATFVAKLCHVSPEGPSAMIVIGSLNATRRKSLSDPTPLTPGEVYELEVPMMPTGWVLRKGHRLRLMLSSSDFPNLWPTPERARNRIYRGGPRASRVILPVAPPASRPPASFLPPPPLVEKIAGTLTWASHIPARLTLPDNRGVLREDLRFRCSASSRDPAQASVTGIHRYVLEREDGATEVVAENSIRATGEAFHVTVNLNVMRNGRPFFQKSWMHSEPRRLF
jgi:predicted acyl esterase